MSSRTNARQQHQLRQRRLAAAVRRAQRFAERKPSGWAQADLTWAIAQYESQTGLDRSTIDGIDSVHNVNGGAA